VPKRSILERRGVAHWRHRRTGNIRVRIVEYSPGYLADHWCSRGHVLYVLEGELVTELQGRPRFTAPAWPELPGGDNDAPPPLTDRRRATSVHRD